MPRAEEAAGSGAAVLTPMGSGTVQLHVSDQAQGVARPHLTVRKVTAPLMTAPLCHPSLPRTRVVAGDTSGAAEDLPEQGGILLAVLDENVLQGLCPVQLVEDDGG